jgi:uncharacterized protein (DUF2237 family)
VAPRVVLKGTRALSLEVVPLALLKKLTVD